MKIKVSTISKFTLRDLHRLDPVNVIFEDFDTGQGKVIIDCYGKAWTAYWRAMGNKTVMQFINSANVEYITSKLTNEPEIITDYDEIADKTGEDVSRETVWLHADKIKEAYGSDWMLDLPTKINPDYAYLTRIVSAVKEAAEYLSGDAHE